MYVLQEATRQAMTTYMTQLARLNGAENFNTAFNVSPAIQQKLIEKYQQQTDFLKRINIVQVAEAHSEKLGLGNDKRIAGTTDTRIQPRRPTTIFLSRLCGGES